MKTLTSNYDFALTCTIYIDYNPNCFIILPLFLPILNLEIGWWCKKVLIFNPFFPCALQGLRLNFMFAKFSVKWDLRPKNESYCRLTHVQPTNICCSILDLINLNHVFIHEVGKNLVHENHESIMKNIKF